MAYEYNPQDVLEFADTVLVEKKRKGSELFFTYCPYCQGGAHKDKNTFSIHLEKGTFKCFRAGCAKQGHFVELARDMGFPLDFGSQKQYKRLPQKKVETTSQAEAYLKGRGIGSQTARRYKITTCKEAQNILVFPFYDENRVLVSVKYRKTNFDRQRDKCKEWFEKDTKPILFGMQECRGFERIVICEGQIDSLSLAECGIQNAVSVPNGARGFTWLANVWDWISQFSQIVVFGDMENGKMTLIDELRKKLPAKILAVRQEDYLGEKDANDILRRYGKEAVKKAVAGARTPPLRHVVPLADVEAVDLNRLPKICTNIPEMDKVIGGLYFGNVILLTGKRGNGKSTLMSQLVCEALDQEYPVFIYSGELAGYHFKRWLDLQLAGPAHIKEYADEVYGTPVFTLDAAVERKINDWYRGRAFLYDADFIEGEETQALADTIEQAICQYGIRLVCIDNLMTALDVGMNEDLYRGQSRFVKRLKRMAVKYDAAVILVAHPRKSAGAFDNDDVSGSADITNAVDVVMSYCRSDTGDCDGQLKITKNRLLGTLTGSRDIPLLYSRSSKRITSISMTGIRRYGWEETAVEREFRQEGFSYVQETDLLF